MILCSTYNYIIIHNHATSSVGIRESLYSLYGDCIYIIIDVVCVYSSTMPLQEATFSECVCLQIPDQDLEVRRVGQKVDPLSGELFISAVYNPPPPVAEREAKDGEGGEGEEEEEEGEEEEEEGEKSKKEKDEFEEDLVN